MLCNISALIRVGANSVSKTRPIDIKWLLFGKNNIIVFHVVTFFYQTALG